MTCPLNLKCIPVRAAERPHEIVSVRVFRGILLSCIVIALLAVPALQKYEQKTFISNPENQ